MAMVELVSTAVTMIRSAVLSKAIYWKAGPASDWGEGSLLALLCSQE